MKRDVELMSGRTVETVLSSVELEDAATAILDGANDLKAGLQGLLEAERFNDAVLVLASALPDREGVGWAWVCAREATLKDSPEEVEAVLTATREWIKEPTDDARRAAMEASEVAGLDSSAGFTGLAAFFCGESITPTDLDIVPPPPGVVGKLVAACIVMAAAEGPANEVEAALKRFAARGVELADRIHLWPEPTTGDDEPA